MNYKLIITFLISIIFINNSHAKIIGMDINNKTISKNKLTYTIENSECSELNATMKDKYSFAVYSRKHYFLHQTLNGQTKIVDQAKSPHSFLGPSTVPFTYDFNFSQPSNSIATYVLRQQRNTSLTITVICGSGGTQQGGNVSTTSVVPDKPYCPRLVPNHLGILSQKSVCMAKFPNKIKANRCNKRGGMNWQTSNGTSYCLWGKSNYWHARPTK